MPIRDIKTYVAKLREALAHVLKEASDVASVAPEISGKIKELRIVDNQFIHKGDLLYVIDPFDLVVALRASKGSAREQVRQAEVNLTAH